MRYINVAYLIAAIVMTLSVFDGHSSIVSFLCIGWQDFDWLSASHGPSAMAELFYTTGD